MIANNRYIGGATSYLDVITAQTVLLTSERLETQLLGQQVLLAPSIWRKLSAVGGTPANLTTSKFIRRLARFCNH